jgi:phage virion morphogenesis protein
MFAFEVGLVDSGITKALSDLQKKMTDLAPVMNQIGEAYKANTELRFKAKQTPDGKQWARNTPTTQRLKAKGMGKRGAGIEGGYSIGVWSGNLRASIGFRTQGNHIFVGVFSNQKAAKYAYVFQHGAEKGSKSPWGNIPPRPFLGFNKVTNEKVLKILKEYLAAP